jgi:hypothetical protein
MFDRPCKSRNVEQNVLAAAITRSGALQREQSMLPQQPPTVSVMLLMWGHWQRCLRRKKTADKFLGFVALDYLKLQRHRRVLQEVPDHLVWTMSGKVDQLPD